MVRSRMLARRDIAAAHVTAGQAEAKMHPVHPHLQAFLTSLGCPRLNIADLVQMTATLHKTPAPDGLQR